MLEYQYSLEIEINPGKGRVSIDFFKEELENCTMSPSFSFCVLDNTQRDPKGSIVILVDQWETDEDHIEDIDELIEFLEPLEDLISFGSFMEVIDRPTFTKRNWVYEREGWNFYEDKDPSYGFNQIDESEDF